MDWVREMEQAQGMAKALEIVMYNQIQALLPRRK
jgi:hypothetical protein